MRQLTFEWTFSHPQLDIFSWTLFQEDGTRKLGGMTRDQNTTITLLEPTERVGYYLEVSWLHGKSGKWTHIYTSPVQYVGPEPKPEPEPEEPFTVRLLIHDDEHMQGTRPLEDGDSLEGNVYIELETSREVDFVRFYIDGTFVRRETAAPYMLAGDKYGVLFPFNTKTLTNGPHTIRGVAISGEEGSDDTFTAAAEIMVEIDNAPPIIVEPPPDPDPDPKPEPEPEEPEPDPDPEPEDPPPPWEGEVPEPPRKRVDISRPAPTGSDIIVRRGESIQAALDRAQGGDQILIEPGVHVENVTLPKRSDGGMVTIRAESAISKDVGPGNHPVVIQSNRSDRRPFSGSGDAEGYWIENIEFKYDDSIKTANSIVNTAHARRVIFNHVTMVGRDQMNLQRSLVMHGYDIAVLNSYLRASYKGADSQAIISYSGEGPYHIEGCDLFGAGENIMFGGATPTAGRGMPMDIMVIHNRLTKPQLWFDDKTIGTVKNLFEIKFAQRLWIEYNIFDGCWSDGQSGYALNLKLSSTANGGDKISDFTFRNNLLRNTDHAAKIGSSFPRMLFENNLLISRGRLFQILSSRDLHLIHNTCIHTHNIITSDGAKNYDSVMIGNIWGAPGGYGVKGSGSEGTSTLNRDFLGHVYRDNGHIGRKADRYPDGNRFVNSIEDVLFDADYRLKNGSPFNGLGADIDAILEGVGL